MNSPASVIEKDPKALPFSTVEEKKTEYLIIPNSLMFREVKITPLALDKMHAYTKFCEYEVGWLGTVREEGLTLILDDVFLFKQEVSAATTELDENDIARYYEDVITNPPEGIDPQDHIERSRVWGHSHVNMGTSPSSTDNETIMNFKENVEGTDKPYFVRIITNKKGELRLDIYYFSLALAALNLPWAIYYDHSLETDPIVEEMRAKLTKRTYNYSGGTPWKKDQNVKHLPVPYKGQQDWPHPDSPEFNEMLERYYSNDGEEFYYG